MKLSILKTIPGIFGASLALCLFQSLPDSFLSKTEIQESSRAPASMAEPDGAISKREDGAEEDTSVAVRLAQSPYDQDGRTTCAYSSLMISYLDELPDAEVRQMLETEIATYEKFIQDTEKTASRKTKNLQRRTLRDLRILTQTPNAREKMKENLELPCRAGVSLGSVMLRTTGMTGTLLTTAITMPIRFVAKFGIGAYMRKGTPNRSVNYSTLTGNAGGITQVSGIVQQVVKLGLGAGNPWTLARLTVFAIDIESADVCSKVNPLNKREVRFCKNYKLIKDNEFKVTEVGEKVGVQVGTTILHTFDFQSDERQNKKICEASVKKQYRVARRAQERLNYRLKNIGVTDYEIKFTPPEIEGCIALQIITKNEEDEIKVAQSGSGIIDGLLYSVIAKENLEITPKEPKPDPVTDEEVCQAIHGTQVAFAANQAAISERKFTVMQMVLNPKRYASMGVDSVKMPEALVYREPLEEIANKRSLIMILAPTPGQKEEFDKIQGEFARISAQFKNRRKKLSKLMKTKSFQACLEKQEDLAFNYQEFKDLSDALSSMQVANRINEFKMFRKETRQAGKKLFVFKNLRMPWEVIEFSNLNDIRRALSSPNVANVIFVSHGESNGKIIDPRFNSLPASVFEWVSPSIQSVSFFSCHTHDAIVSYKLKDHLGSQATVHPIRYVGYVNTADFLEDSNQAPSTALSGFIEDLDKQLSLAQEGTRRAQSVGRASLKPAQPIALCTVQVDQAQVIKGSFAVKVNSKWAGVLYPETTAENTKFSFPCNWLKTSGNRVFLENISLTERSSLEIQAPAVRVLNGTVEKTITPLTENIRRRAEDQSISALSFIW